MNVRIIKKINRSYTLLKRLQTTYQPYVVAWKFDPVTSTWAQGHYFHTLKAAEDWIKLHVEN